MICFWNGPDDLEATRITEAEAIQRVKAYAANRGNEYPNDAEALTDFIVIHWAWREPVEIFDKGQKVKLDNKDTKILKEWLLGREMDIATDWEDFGELQNVFRKLIGRQAQRVKD